MADWYIYQHDGDPLGPWPTEAVAEAILVGKLAPDVWVAAPGGPRWLRALDVPVIGCLVAGVPTRPRRDSGLRLMPGAFTSENERPVFGATMMIVKDDELLASAEPATTRRGHGPRDETEAQAPSTRVSPDADVDNGPATLPQMPRSSTPSAPAPGSSAQRAELRHRKA